MPRLKKMGVSAARFILFCCDFHQLLVRYKHRQKHPKRRGLMMGDKTPNKPPKKKQKSEKKSAAQPSIMKEATIKKPKK